MLRRFLYDAPPHQQPRDVTINKSLISNLLAAMVVVAGLLMTGPYQLYVLNTGLFALSGGITNWLAVHMLFERVPGLYGSGVIQLRFEDFKLGIRNLVMDQFFNHSDLESFFHGSGDTGAKLSEKLKQGTAALDLEQAFESLLDVIMASSFSGMLGMIGGRDALSALKDPFVARMEDFLNQQFADPAFQAKIQEALQGALDEEAIRAKLTVLIDKRLNEMTPAMVKEIVQTMIRKHLGWLVVWGCAFGGVIGLSATFLTQL